MFLPVCVLAQYFTAVDLLAAAVDDYTVNSVGVTFALCDPLHISTNVQLQWNIPG